MGAPIKASCSSFAKAARPPQVLVPGSITALSSSGRELLASPSSYALASARREFICRKSGCSCPRSGAASCDARSANAAAKRQARAAERGRMNSASNAAPPAASARIATASALPDVAHDGCESSC
eukprot:CAMPEP_0115573888 /NCGR_PEP_ID=MMETSP0272-20121206/1239_1 /TAXON_ID=71861 /ORGANISM="Scrippsiella trochoidea, Strain CCMP3099" /LENGTH=124 /DNA_ID=CAMNT_0003008583 /DNA_START=186 /DNA_END=560 /DNA_ORIENTATION=+